MMFICVLQCVWEGTRFMEEISGVWEQQDCR